MAPVATSGFTVELWQADTQGELDFFSASNWSIASRAVKEAKDASRMFGCIAFVTDLTGDERLVRCFHNGREIKLPS